MLEILVRPPGECSSAEFEAFRQMLSLRPGIDGDSIERRMKKTEFLAFAYDGPALAGIGAVKKTGKGYRRRIVEGRSGEIPSRIPRLEIGWMYVHEPFRGRGIGTLIHRALMEKLGDESVFALTAPDNRAADRMLVSTGFSRCCHISLENRPIYVLYLKENSC